MEYLHPTDCINKVSHLNKKRNRIENEDLPDIKKLKIDDVSKEIIIRVNNNKFDYNENTNEDKEKNKEEATKLKIESIEKKIQLFKLCMNKCIDYLNEEIIDLKKLNE